MATSNKSVDFESMNDDELLNQEKAIKEALAKLFDAKKHREENMRNKAFDEIKVVLEKNIPAVISEEVFTAWLQEHQYIKVAKAVATSTGGTKGPRKVDPDALLFSKKYVPEGGERKMTFKLEKDSAYPANISKTHKVAEELKTKTFEELKPFFTAKFFEFIKDEKASFSFINRFFPQIEKDIETITKA